MIAPTPRPAASDELDIDNTLPVRHFTVADLAVRWRVSPRSLERWRADLTGPAWIKLPGRVVYRLEDVLAYERENLTGP